MSDFAAVRIHSKTTSIFSSVPISSRKRWTDGDRSSGLAGGRFQFEYYGLPTPFDAEPEAKRHKIEAVPTAILYVGDKEIGRIPNSQWSNPEVALDLQLNGPGRTR